jgi:hypothetical protein
MSRNEATGAMILKTFVQQEVLLLVSAFPDVHLRPCRK